MLLDGIKLITFDAAGTLFIPHPSVGEIYAEVMERHGLDCPAKALQAGFESAFLAVSKDFTIKDGELRERSFWKAIVNETLRSLSAEAKDFDSLFDELWNVFSEGRRWRTAAQAKETLVALRERGLKVALLTNWDSRVHSVLREQGLESSFDRVFVSSEIGHEKPDIEIFRHVENEMEIAPTEILHIGDSLKHDVAGAIAAGWKHAWLSTHDSGKGNGVFRINDLRQLSL